MTVVSSWLWIDRSRVPIFVPPLLDGIRLSLALPLCGNSCPVANLVESTEVLFPPVVHRSLVPPL